MGHQAMLCMQVHSRGCEQIYLTSTVTPKVESLKAELQPKCMDMMKNESSEQKNSTQKCEMQPALVPCVGDIKLCFNSMDPTEICSWVQSSLC